MKKNTFIIYLLGFNFLFLSCTFDESDYKPDTVENSQTEINLSGKPARTDLAFITQQLTYSYKVNFNDSGMSLGQKINLLDSAGMSVPLFVALRPVNYTLPEVVDAQIYLNNYITAYTNLNVSLKMKGYLNSVIETDVSDYYLIMQALEIDSLLTINEKERLQFIVTYLQDTANSVYGGPKDESWKRRNIVAAIQGFETSNANAVFNVALVSIVQ